MTSVPSSAQGSEPRPPAFETAMARALTCTPAIGAWTIGISTPSRSSRASRVIPRLRESFREVARRDSAHPESVLCERWLPVGLQELDDLPRGSFGRYGHTSGGEVVEHLCPRELVGRPGPSVSLHLGVDDAGLVAEDRSVFAWRRRRRGRVPLPRERHPR